MHRIVDSRCVLAVRDLQASTRFYLDVLGFRRDLGDGSDGWSFLSRDAFKIMLGECPARSQQASWGTTRTWRI
jgi:catechol 2,3-dioxygenase-like lactoylglutathione lyase family enzyme